MALKDAVKALQKELNDLGADLKEDGKAGPKTQAALALAYEGKLKPKAEPEATDEIEGAGLNERSLKNLATCHPDLQRLAAEMRREIDFVVICGHRNKADQDKAFRDGFSKTPWPKSKHNKVPSLAFDAINSRFDWNDAEHFTRMRAIAKACAARLGIKIRLISWDKPHIELA